MRGSGAPLDRGTVVELAIGILIVACHLAAMSDYLLGWWRGEHHDETRERTEKTEDPDADGPDDDEAP